MLRSRLALVIIALVFGVVGFGVSVGIAKSHTSKPAATVTEIQLLKDRAEPTAITVKVGETVQFNAKDGRTHDIARGSGGLAGVHTATSDTGPSSGQFGADEGYRLTMKEAGTFDFYDKLDPRLSVTIIVYVEKVAT